MEKKALDRVTRSGARSRNERRTFFLVRTRVASM